MPVGARTGGDTLNHLSMARAGPQQRACHAPARCGAVSPHVCADLVCALGPSGATAGTPLLHGVSDGCDAVRCRTTDLPERTLLSWLHRVTPVERENRERPSDTVSLHPTSLVRAQTRLRFYIVQNNMQYSDAHRRYNFVRGGLSLTRLYAVAVYCVQFYSSHSTLGAGAQEGLNRLETIAQHI